MTAMTRHQRDATNSRRARRSCPGSRCVSISEADQLRTERATRPPSRGARVDAPFRRHPLDPAVHTPHSYGSSSAPSATMRPCDPASTSTSATLRPCRRLLLRPCDHVCVYFCDPATMSTSTSATLRPCLRLLLRPCGCSLALDLANVEHATRYTLHATRYTLHATRYTLHATLLRVLLPCFCVT